MRLKALPTTLVALAVGLGVAACGGSGTAGGINTVPGGGVTSAVTATTTTSSDTTTTSVTTPKTGALSKEPSFSVPKGKAPKKLEVKTLVKGTGTTAEEGDTLYVNYVGKIYATGKTFQASWTTDPGKTVAVTLKTGTGGVITGWVDGLVGKKQGGRYELIIPPSEGYGSTAESGIPANSTLVFVVDIVKVVK